MAQTRLPLSLLLGLLLLSLCAVAQSNIKTVVVLMQENRSFDHMSFSSFFSLSLYLPLPLTAPLFSTLLYSTLLYSTLLLLLLSTLLSSYSAP